MDALQDRFAGALLGLACGDAVGTTLEFSPRGSFQPITDMVGGGPFKLAPGQWTDDTSMALCLAESLAEKEGFDPADQMTRYLNWWHWGYLSSTGNCFDIGSTVRSALTRFQDSGEPYSGSTDPWSAGNGSLMRLAPVVLFAYGSPDKLAALAAQSSRTTHGAAEAIECCQLFAQLIRLALSGCPKNSLLRSISGIWHQDKVKQLATGDFISKPDSAIKGSGYCVESLEAALWCFFNTDSYPEAILAAANLGDDADTTAAISGQMAGAFYGAAGIPAQWREKLTMREDIEHLATRLYQLGTARNKASIEATSNE